MYSLLLLSAAAVAAAQDDVSFNVHLALSSDPTQMFVSWRTNSSAAPATVAFGSAPGALTNLASGASWTFTDTTSRAYYLHRATLTGLSPGARVYYRAGGAASAVSSFLATRSPSQFSDSAPLRIAWLGDLGYTNGQALDYLLKESAAGTFDHYVHVGDYAYDLNYQDGRIGDLFEAGIEPITSTAPYMGCEGNHEGANGFAHYANRFAVFSMDNSSAGTTNGVSGIFPTAWNNHWYSYDVGLVHFVALSTETYFSYGGLAAQYAWADADLAAVDRAKTPWVIVYGHRSIYCSCDTDCDAAATTVRLGPKGDGAGGMEALFKKHGVDLWINGHEHNAERSYPVYNGKLATGPSGGKPGGNASNPEVIVNAVAPVYIVEGCAGDVEHHEPFTRPQPPYSAFRSNTYGYGRMTVYNATTLLWEQVQTDDEYPATTGSVIDAMLLLKGQ